MLGAVMMPHPPLLIPEVGRGGEAAVRETADACLAAAGWLLKRRPDTVLVLSPHSVLYRDYFHLSPGEKAEGSFGRFGAAGVRLSAAYDAPLREQIARDARAAGLPAGTRGERDAALDHGTLVPLYFLRQAAGGTLPFQILRAGFSGLSYGDHYRLGQVIAGAARALGRRLCVVASGDLSHRLREDGPYGFDPQGPRYDARLMDIMGRAAFGELLAMPEADCEQAGECGQRSFIVMAGCLDGLSVRAQVLSYQGVTGVGYGVAVFEPGGPDPARHFLERQREEQALARSREGPYARLARQAVEHFVETGSRLPLPEGLPEEMLSRRAGVFVTIHKEGRLRGCIGTIKPLRDCVAQEILDNAVSAAARDSRFDPVTPGELPLLTLSVDVLEAPEDIDSPEELDPARYGVIVRRGSRSGLLLPNLEGVDSVEEQLAIARRKAGIGEGEPVRLQRFRVHRHH